MKQKKIPMRSCVVTGEKLPKRELLRIVRTTDGTVVCDLSGKINGRGAYIKKDVDVLEEAKKTKILEKRLECTISDETYEEVKNEIEKM
ncbi:MAG: YlxR family protein [Erysipelatoclostridium sp.]|nr:YlxR family protein [Thomasclavelia sp.]